MSVTTTSALFSCGTGVPVLTTSQVDRINQSISFIRTFALTKYGKDITGVVFFVVKSMSQPGLCVNWSRIDAKVFLKPQLKDVIPETSMTGTTVLINLSSPDAEGTLWPPVLFHECGHSMFDGTGGPNEPAAWRVELEASFAWVQLHEDQKADFQTFVKARQKVGMYSKFPSGTEASAKDALSKLM